MKLNHILAATAMVLVGATAAHAAPITYTGAETLVDGANTATVDLSITTNGTLGTFYSASDITGFNVDITSGTTSLDLTPSNTTLQLTGFNLSATANALNFNFATPNGASALAFLSTSDGNEFFCLQTSAYCDAPGSAKAAGEVADLTSKAKGSPTDSAVFYTAQAGQAPFAMSASTVSAAPEPSAWALMIVGVGGIGFAFRQAKGRGFVVQAIPA